MSRLGHKFDIRTNFRIFENLKKIDGCKFEKLIDIRLLTFFEDFQKRILGMAIENLGISANSVRIPGQAYPSEHLK